MIFLTAVTSSDFSRISTIKYSQILKLREINSRDDIINRAIEEFNFSIFLGQNSNTTVRGEGELDHDLFARLPRNKDGKRDEAIGPPSDGKERQSFLK